MGKAISKVGLKGAASTTAVDHEFQYRYTNTKTLRSGLRALIKSINESNTAVMNTPARMADVGESYLAINACMNHGGAGGVSQSTNNPDPDEDEALSLPPTSAMAEGQTRINRELAKEAYDNAQAFVEAMRHLRETNYQTYRAGVVSDVIQKAEAVIAKADKALLMGKEAEAATNKHMAAASKVDSIEAKCAKRGKEASKDQKYDSCVRTRLETGRLSTDKKNVFHEAYEELMGLAQAFSVQSLDSYLDLTAAYKKELVRLIDSTGSPVKRLSVMRERGGHEPAQ